MSLFANSAPAAMFGREAGGSGPAWRSVPGSFYLLSLQQLRKPTSQNGTGSATLVRYVR
jgi:hypothetical protein